MTWTFRFETRVSKDLSKIDKTTQQRIIRFLKQREDRVPQEYARPLTGEYKGFWRIRIGDYRVIIQFDEKDKLISVYEIAHRKDIYRP